jgi:nucleotide-binding universal stress UspA family protein
MHILLATDGSAGAANASRLVASLPLGAGSRVTLLTVLPRGSSEDGGARFAAAADMLASSDADVSRKVRYGLPAEEILAAEAEDNPDLLVLGSRGMSAVARFWMGSVAERVAQYSQGPVLIVWPEPTRIQRVLVGVDRSPFSQEVAGWFMQFPLPPGTELHWASFVTLMDVFARWRRTLFPPASAILRVLERQECRHAREHLEALVSGSSPAAFPSQIDVRTGDPAEGLVELAQELSADLLVVGSRGMGLGRVLLFGSVSDRLLTQQCASLLIVKIRGRA